MAAVVEKEPLTPAEEELLNNQVLPILHTVLPPAFVPRALTAIREAVEQSKKRHGMPFGGMYPNSAQIGIQPLSAKDFNFATTWTLRTNWATTTWRTGAQALIAAQTLSKYTHLVICAYENLEPTPRTLAVKETVGGIEHPTIDLTEIKKSDRQIQPIEPYIASPVSVFNLEVFVEEKGYDNLRPWGFVVAPYSYLISKDWIS